jgi:hypothetical protein
MEQSVDGIQIVNGQFKTLKNSIIDSKLLKKASKTAKKGAGIIKRENSKRPLWRVVVGFLLCLGVAYKFNFYKYAVKGLIFGTVKMLWNFLLSLTVAPSIEAWNNNRKVK